jgi:glycosyltransferase involved in cell wall biosynthesis
MKRQKLITIVIPVYNEAKGIPELLRQVKTFINSDKHYAYEVIYVENGSTDASFTLLHKAVQKEKRFKILQLVKNVGCDGGIMAGMQQASGDACIVIMADLQEPLAVVSEFIKKMGSGV